jgi:AraC-like DNA-binding protein
MSIENCNIFSLEENEQLIPGGVTNFLLSDSNGLPVLPPEHYSVKPNLPFFFNGLLMGICVKGEASVSINFKQYTLKANSTLIVQPSLVCRIEKQTDDFAFEGFFFSFNFFVGLVLPADFKALLQIGRHPCMEIGEADMTVLRGYYHNLVERYRQTQLAYRVQIMRGILYAMLLYIVSLYKDNEIVRYSGTQTRQEEITAKFMTLLNDHYKTNRTVAFYANKLCISSKYLSQVIKITTGRPVLQWITDRVISQAKLLLRTTSMSAFQVADELNFPNPSFFGQFFKKHTGTTPYKFRRS